MTHPDSSAPRFAYVILYVPNVEAALSFYQRAFGLSRRFLHESGQYGELETGATALAFADERATPTSHSFALNRLDATAAGAEVAMVVSDVQQAFAHALEAGASPVLAPAVMPWGQTISYVRDLNGFLVELCSDVANLSEAG